MTQHPSLLHEDTKDRVTLRLQKVEDDKETDRNKEVDESDYDDDDDDDDEKTTDEEEALSDDNNIQEEDISVKSSDDEANEMVSLKNDNKKDNRELKSNSNDKNITQMKRTGKTKIFRRRGWRKPLDRPRRPPCAYNLFFQLERQRLIYASSNFQGRRSQRFCKKMNDTM
jgi:hypothetical protein